MNYLKNNSEIDFWENLSCSDLRRLLHNTFSWMIFPFTSSFSKEIVTCLALGNSFLERKDWHNYTHDECLLFPDVKLPAYICANRQSLACVIHYYFFPLRVFFHHVEQFWQVQTERAGILQVKLNRNLPDVEDAHQNCAEYSKISFFQISNCSVLLIYTKQHNKKNLNAGRSVI